MSVFDTFTKKQKATYTLVHDLEDQLMEVLDPTAFVLNPKVLEIYRDIESVQQECDHIWENGHCVVCNKEEEPLQ